MRAAKTKYHRLGDLTTAVYFLTNLVIKVSAELVSFKMISLTRRWSIFPQHLYTVFTLGVPPGLRASLVAQMVKHLPATRETWVPSLGWEDPLEKEMASHSSTLAWKIPWMEEPGGPQSMGLQRVGHD